MQLYEKLNFLLGLTSTSNRMLAQAIQVDPSLISRLRTGARGLPRDQKYAKPMAQYFARRCTTDYQRQALSEMLGIRQAISLDNAQLSDILYYWLCGETDEVTRFMRTFETFSLAPSNTGAEKRVCPVSTGNSVYYDNEGKRAAARAVYQHLLSLERPGAFFVFSDESDDWIMEDYSFSRNLQEWGMNLLNRGFPICHITPPVTSINAAFDSLIRWIPLYMTGQVAVYVYPKLWNNVHQRTVAVLPGEIAMTSNSITGHNTSHVTLLTADERLTQAYAAEFQDYLALCRPMLNAFTQPEKLMKCFTEFLFSDGVRIQQVVSLSAESAPPELLAFCMQKIKEPNLQKLGNLYLQEIETIAKKRENYALIDIAYLASAREVRDGTVPIIFSYGVDTKPIYYTPESYVLHLRNILRLMEHYSNYHFVPLHSEEGRRGTLMVKEGSRALLVRVSPPMAAFEISQPDIVQLCREHLIRIANRVGYTGINRIKIMSRIKELIRELQDS